MYTRKTPKIAIITNIFPHYRKNLFEKLNRVYDIRFFFFSNNLTPYWESKNKINIGNFKGEYLTGFWITKKLRVTPSLIYKIIKGRYDVIIQGIGGRFALPVTFLLAKLLGSSFILWTGLWQHPKTFFHMISYPFAKFIYKHSDAILVYGEHVKKYLISLGIGKDKIFIATQAVNNSQFRKDILGDEKRKLKENLRIVNKKVILFVGQLEIYKGIYYLLDAMTDFRDEDVCLLFIGRGSQYKNLMEIVRKRKLKNVFFLGYIDNEMLYRYYAIADVFVLPSITTEVFKEPWGLVINEAMNQGCPVIATDAVGAVAGGLVRHGVNGFVIGEKNSQSLNEALRKVLNSKELRQKMSQNTKEMIKDWTDEKRLDGFTKAINFVRSS